MPGAYCCVNNCTSRARDRHGNKTGIRFFCFPEWKRLHGEQLSEVTKRRRMAWIAAVRRKDITFDRIAHSMKVCSRHFHSGQPAYEMLENHPDWKPSLMLGHSDVRETDQGRYQRHFKRRAKAKWPTGQSKKHQQPPQPQPPPHQDVVQQEEVQQHQDQHQDQQHQDQQLLAEVKEEVVEVRLGVDVEVESEDEAEQEVEQEVKEEVEREVERLAPLPDKELPPNQDAVQKPPSPHWNSYHHNDHSSMARAPQPRREHPPNQDTVQPPPPPNQDTVQPPPPSGPGSFYQILQTQHDDHSGMARVECSLCKSRQDLINCLLEEKRELAKQLEEYRMNEGFLKGDDGKVRYYTGLPNLEVFQMFLLSVVPLLQQGKRKLTPFQYVLLTLMRLRLDLPIQHLSYLFGVNRSTVSAAFQETVGLLHSLLCRDEDGLFSSIPRSFVESFKGKCQKVLSDAESVAPRKRTSKNGVAVKDGGSPKESDTTADSVTAKNSGSARDGGVTPKPSGTPKDTKDSSTPKDSVSTIDSGTMEDSGA